MKFFLSSLLILIALVPLRLNGQGCSDAGFCSIGDLKTQLTQTDANHKNAIAPGASLGIGLEGTLVLTPYLEYSRKLSERAVLNAKLTAVYATGDLGSNFDIGDLFFSGSYVVAQKKN
ncbi:MAG: hypothetical protein IPP71_03365 [Bacteroidetes bacterium]|nr:hypothetical protein [Bacteroidota bacterium]